MGFLSECNCFMAIGSKYVVAEKKKITNRMIVDILKKHGVECNDKSRSDLDYLNIHIIVSDVITAYPNFPTYATKSACLKCNTCIGWDIDIEREVIEAANIAMDNAQKRFENRKMEEDELELAKRICQ